MASSRRSRCEARTTWSGRLWRPLGSARALTSKDTYVSYFPGGREEKDLATRSDCGRDSGACRSDNCRTRMRRVLLAAALLGLLAPAAQASTYGSGVFGT